MKPLTKQELKCRELLKKCVDVGYRNESVEWGDGVIDGHYLDFTIPIQTMQTKKKIYYFSLNNLINISAIPCLRNKMKQQYEEEIRPIISVLPKNEKINIEIHCKVFLKNKALSDLDNITSVTIKYLQDALVKYGVIEADDYRFIKKLYPSFGGIDPEFTRAEIRLTYDIPES